MHGPPSSADTSAPRARLFGAAELVGAVTVPFVAEQRFLLLALLALRRGGWVPRDEAAALFWPDRSTRDARRNLRKVLLNARAVPGAQGVQASEHALRWAVDTDLEAFHRALQQGRFADAVALRRGPLLAGITPPGSAALAEWLAAERSRWDQDWHAAALAHLRALPDPQAQAWAARRLLEVDACDESALAALLAAELALGRPLEAQAEYRRYAERLAEQLGVEPSQAVRELLRAPIPAASAQGLVQARAAPGDASAFVGRRTELAELSHLLAQPDCRALTLLGPGGIGKSRLAQQLLPGPAAGLTAGWRWIELEDLTDLPGVVARIAQRLDVMVGDGGDLVEPLLRRLGAERWLLVLDNAEHLAGLPALLQRLLDGAAGLALLVTSRMRLHLRGEWLYLLSGLAVPDDESRDLETASRFDAVRMFELRARAAQHDFRLDHHVDAVIDIVAAVAGMPLAIELAASWVRLLPADEIARDLRGSIDLLERDPATTLPPARSEHASMRAVLDRAWALLAPPERDALAALSMFQGGFTRAAARAVADCALPLLSSLADKSLLVVGEQARFALHPIVAAYAAEQLAAREDDRQAVQRRHAEFHANLFARLAPHATGDPRLLVAGVGAEFANGRAAWQTAVRLRRADLVADLVRALWAFFENRGRQREGVELLSSALALPGQGVTATRAQARLRHGLSMLHHRIGDQAQGLAIALSGVEQAEHSGDTEAWVGCVLNAGSCLWQMGQTAQAQAQFERGVAIARERGERQCLAWALGNLGVALMSIGRYDEARDLLQQALAGSREIGDQYNVAVHLVNLSGLERDSGDLATSRRHLEDALRHCAGYDIVPLAQYVALNLGHLLRRAGDGPGAEARYAEALAMALRTGSQLIEWSAEIGLARLAVAQGDLAAALRRLRRVAPSARAKAATQDLAMVAMVHGDVLAAHGDGAGAARAWRAARDAQVLSAGLHQDIAARLALLPPQDWQVDTPTLDGVLAPLLG